MGEINALCLNIFFNQVNLPLSKLYSLEVREYAPAYRIEVFINIEKFWNYDIGKSLLEG